MEELKERLEELDASAQRAAADEALERLQAQAAALVATDPVADRAVDSVADSAAGSVADRATDSVADPAADRITGSAAHVGDVPLTPSKED